MSHKVIESLIQFEKGYQSVWEEVTSPVPDKALAYAIDTKILKLGNGVNTFSTLPVLLDLNKSVDAHTFNKQFAHLVGANANSLISVNTTGSYEYSDKKINTIVTQARATDGVSTKSVSSHIHDDLYFTTSEVDKIAAGMLQMSPEDDDILSYLLTKTLSDEHRSAMPTPTGYVDEYEDTIGIDVANNTMTVGVGSVSGTVIQSIAVTHADADVMSTRVYLRGSECDDINAETTVELTRDGSTWAAVPMSESNLSLNTNKVYVGDCNFNKACIHATTSAEAATLENMKGNRTTFVVDTAGVSGHFDVAVPATIVAALITTDAGYIQISQITGDGTATDSVLFTGTFAAGPHAITGIYGIQTILGSPNKIQLAVGGSDDDVWVKLADAIALRRNHSAAVIGGKMYVHGGTSNSVPLNDIYVYDPSTNVWTKLSDAPVARLYHSAVAIGGKMYVHGGFSSSSVPIKDTYAYDPTTDGWTKLADGPIERAHHTAVVINSKMYIFGGVNSTGALGTNHVYDPATDLWTQLTSASFVRRYHAAAAVDGRMYITGGWDGSNLPVATTYAYDPIANSWAQVLSAPVIRYCQAAIEIGGKMYVHGGVNSSHAEVKDTYVYDPIANTWTQLLDGTISRTGHTAVNVNNKMCIHGGGITTSVFNDTYAFALDTVIRVGAYQTAIFNTIADSTKLTIAGTDLTTTRYAVRHEDSFYVYKNNEWTAIATCNTATSKWQYRNASLTFVDAIINTPHCAISSALDAGTFNQMTSAEFLGIDLSNTLTSQVAISFMPSSAATISGIEAYGYEALVAPAGKAIAYRIRSVDPVTLQGIRLHWK